MYIQSASVINLFFRMKLSRYFQGPMKKQGSNEFPNYLKRDKRTKEVSCQYSEYLNGTPCSTKRKSRVQCECPVNSQTYTVRIDNAMQNNIIQ